MSSNPTPPNPRKVSVGEIKSKLLIPALTSHYEVYILPPPAAETFINNSGFKGNMQETLMLSCFDTSLPGSQLATHDLNNDFTGVSQKHAYRRQYDDRIDFSFYVNNYYEQIRYFESWIRYISGEEINDGESIQNHYRMKYPIKYKSPVINVTKFERDPGSATATSSGYNTYKMVYSFVNAFPISVTSMPVSYESSQLLKVSVSFSYDRYIAGNASIEIVPGTPFEESTQQTATATSNPINTNLSPAQQASINQTAFNRNTNFGLNLPTFSNTFNF